MTTQAKLQRALALIQNIQDNFSELNELWEDDDVVSGSLNRCYYPFEKSFGEIDIKRWKESYVAELESRR